MGFTPQDAHSAGQAAVSDAAQPEPALDERLAHACGHAKAGVVAGFGALRALRRLVVADMALARAALVRAGVWLVVAVVFAACSWPLLMGALVAALREVVGLSWLAALAIPAGLSLLVTALGVWRAVHYVGMSQMKATRRQLRALGLGADEDAADACATGVDEAGRQGAGRDVDGVAGERG